MGQRYLMSLSTTRAVDIRLHWSKCSQVLFDLDVCTLTLLRSTTNSSVGQGSKHDQALSVACQLCWQLCARHHMHDPVTYAMDPSDAGGHKAICRAGQVLLISRFCCRLTMQLQQSISSCNASGHQTHLAAGISEYLLRPSLAPAPCRALVQTHQVEYIERSPAAGAAAGPALQTGRDHMREAAMQCHAECLELVRVFRCLAQGSYKCTHHSQTCGTD